MSVEQDIMTQIETNMNLISVANGYNNDIDGVYTWREFDLPNSVSKAINIMDPHEEINEEELLHVLDIEIQGLASGTDSPQTIRSLKEDILTAFALIENESYVSGAVYMMSDKYVEMEKRKVSGIAMYFQVEFKTEEWET